MQILYWIGRNRLVLAHGVLIAVFCIAGIIVGWFALATWANTGLFTTDLFFGFTLILLAGVNWFGLRRARMNIRSSQWLSEGRCGHCGYDTRGLVSSFCPECGTKLTTHSAVPDVREP